MESCFAYAGIALLYLGIAVVVAAVGWLAGQVRKAGNYDAAMRELDAARQRERDVRRAEQQVEEARSQVDADRRAVETLAEEKSEGFPWLAGAYADYFHLQAMREADLMERKRHPAPRSAERLREVARQRRNVEKKLRIAQGIIKYYQELFPFLEEFLRDVDDEVLKSVLAREVEGRITDVGDVGVDPVRVYLSEEEYASLSTAEKNQLALERYWERGKSKWEIGRNYERYVGYLYEREGYAVCYQGILEGFDDLGRDLICKKGQQTLVVQCKCWRQQYQIHEKHVNQLYGTTIKYRIEHPEEQAFAVLFTSTTLSDRAREFAAHLGVTVSQEVPLAQYPWVKCNVSRRTGELIYHLPFDQMYDRTLIEDERNERYAWTATEAEELGFRRAWRWRGEGSE